MRIVEVELPGRARRLACTAEDPELSLDDRVVVENDGRLVFGVCARVPLDLPYGEPARAVPAARRAAGAEEARDVEQQHQRDEYLEAARGQVDAMGLPMRILRAEPAGGGRRVTFYFLADGRVDFRDLVRDLSRRLRARVELRQIGVRDAAVLQGGYGHCGQPLCCSRFLSGFAPVSMKMAKAQGLPLNPAKISGQCSRLMCCLRFETGGDAPQGADAGDAGAETVSAGPGGGGGNGNGSGSCHVNGDGRGGPGGRGAGGRGPLCGGCNRS